MISPAIVEVNYEVLESLLREQRRHIRNEDLRTELECFRNEKELWDFRKHRTGKEAREEGTPKTMYAPPNMPMYPNPTSSFTDSTGSVTPFIRWIEDYPLSDGLKMPSHIGSYDGKGEPDNFLHLFEGAIYMPKCQQKKFIKIHLAVHNIKQREGESNRAFITKYTDDTLQILGLHKEQRISGFVHGLRIRILVEHLSTYLPTTYKGLMEKNYTWIEAREVATNGTPNNRRENFERSKKSYRDDNHGQKDRDRFSLYRGPSHELLSTLSKIPREILATEKAARSFEQPPRMFGSRWYQEKNKYCQLHKDHGHDMNQCRELKHQVDEVVKSGQLAHLVKRVKKKATTNKNQNKVTRPSEDVRRCLRMDYRTHDGSPEKSNNRKRNLQHRAHNKRAQTLGNSKAEKEKPSARKKRSDLHPSRGAYKGQHFTRSQVSDMDAYKGYHQMPIAEKDEEKTAFYTRERVFCYRRLPFDLKITGATYQRLIDKVFNHQLGRNMEVNAGDIVIKSDVEEEMLANIKETLDGIRAINLKLNPKKCSFVIEEGIFSGHLITKQGIKENPSKVKAISDLQPPKSVSKIQNLNKKLAALNRILLKGVDKTLPFMRTLKSCTSGKMVQWTAKADKAF
uniref:Reverse transcriptase domain-containing protein n=1 Tax=Tanacetum cinerariifolium TaxID=118510 RepID=A0A6L2KML1_TANCI|nr:reverse transcriptase domain-containing protein [Tanacetum cinerariifolium]